MALLLACGGQGDLFTAGPDGTGWEWVSNVWEESGLAVMDAQKWEDNGRMRVGVRSSVEGFLKSFAFSAVLAGYCGFFAAGHARALLAEFNGFEALYFAYNAVVAVFFLVRSRPTVVSVDVRHWTVALVTSLSGLLFLGGNAASSPMLLRLGEGLIGAGVTSALVAAVALGRSWDIAPALRRIRTGAVYRLVRHPIYLSSMVMRLGFVLKHPGTYNVVLLLIVAVLYDRRARYEEQVLVQDPAYVEYLQRVRYRFLPGVY